MTESEPEHLGGDPLEHGDGTARFPHVPLALDERPDPEQEGQRDDEADRGPRRPSPQRAPIDPRAGGAGRDPTAPVGGYRAVLCRRRPARSP